MKKSLILCIALVALFAVGSLGALSLSTVATADATVGTAGLPTTVLDQLETEFGLCGPPIYACPDVYAPVICDNGVTYPNSCYASLACATGCTPTGAI